MIVLDSSAVLASSFGEPGFEPVDWQQVMIASELDRSGRALGLSLGDRCCLALAMVYDLPVLTADRAWAQLRLGLKIELLR